jgi:anhydro-N-acetylmuramic acid kinase
MESSDRCLTAIGLMSGTSMDGIDVAVIESDGVRVRGFGPFSSRPYDAELRAMLQAVVADPASAEHDPLPELTARLTEAHAQAVRDLIAQSDLSAEAIDIVGFHGQTVLHRPERGFTRQLGDGRQLAHALGVDVVCDFRTADMAAGGQGAPFAPLFHQALARDLAGPIAVLNLGGVGNLTYLDGDRVIAFDTGPGNALLDDWMARHGAGDRDQDGSTAAAGRSNEALLSLLLEHVYFERSPPKSLDRNDFSAASLSGLSLEDGAATLTAFTAASVQRALAHLPQRPKRWLVCGGGRRNRSMMAMLAERLAVPVDPVESVGWMGDALEAQAFAYLAIRSLRALPLSLPSTTGVRRPTTGGALYRCAA